MARVTFITPNTFTLNCSWIFSGDTASNNPLLAVAGVVYQGIDLPEFRDTFLKGCLYGSRVCYFQRRYEDARLLCELCFFFRRAHGGDHVPALAGEK